MKKFFMIMGIVMSFLLVFGFLTGGFKEIADNIDSDTEENTETSNISSDDVTTSGSGSSTPSGSGSSSGTTVTLHLYTEDGLQSQTKNSTDPSIACVANTVEFCGSVIYTSSKSILGLSIDNDGNVTSSGDINLAYAAGKTLTPGTHTFYVVYASGTTPSNVTTLNLYDYTGSSLGIFTTENAPTVSFAYNDQVDNGFIYFGGQQILDFAADDIVGLSVANDGNVTSSGDIAGGTSTTLTVGETYTFYLVCASLGQS